MPRALNLPGWIIGQQRRASAQQLGAAGRDYQPRQCRTRGCTQHHLHAGRCNGPNRQPSQVKVPNGMGGRAERRAARRAAGALGPMHNRIHQPRVGGVVREASRERMRRYRAHEPQTFTVTR